MKAQHVFDRVLTALGLDHPYDLAVALGRTPKAAWNWRHYGFPKRLHSELQVLSGQLQKPLPPEFYESTGIPSPQSVDGAVQISETTPPIRPTKSTRKTVPDYPPTGDEP